MENLQLPLGNGQEIYIEIGEFDIRPEWVNKELQAIFFPEDKGNPFYEYFKEFFLELFEKGYKVITDSSLVKEDTFFFSPCLDKHNNETKADYDNKKKRKVAFYLAEEGIKEPYTITFPPDSFPSTLPPLPFIFKNEEAHGGMEKILIKTPEQLEILKRFYNEIDYYYRKQLIAAVKRNWSHLKGLEFDENGRPNMPGPSIDFENYKNLFHENIVLQKFIKMPTKYNTSLRVLTSSTGDILASSLKYSESSKDNKKRYYGYFDKYLLDSSSPYFLDSDMIVSNTVSGGNSILLGKESYSELEQEILMAHGIDPENAVVPPNIRNACINIAVNCRREIGAICGLDFIYDAKEKNWKYLEEHEFPMLYSYAEKYNLPYDLQAEDVNFMNKFLDLRARVDVLVLTMEKNQELTSSNTKKI